MDLSGYWQENRRFVVTVAVGAAVFFAGYAFVHGRYQGKISRAESAIQRAQSGLNTERFSAGDQDLVEAENAALEASLARLETLVAFAPRAEFVIDPAAGSAGSQYLRTLASLREELLPRASRAGLVVDGGLGMPKLSPTKEEEIVRTLEALDLVETVVSASIDARIARIDKIQVRLDPGLTSREGLGKLERTRVEFTFVASAKAMESLLTRTRRAKDGRALVIEDLELVPSRSKEDELKLDVTFIVARLDQGSDRAPEESSDDEPGGAPSRRKSP
jgi:hypothetical protein